MNTTNSGSNVIQFPEARNWAAIAKKYVDYVLMSDPRAACYYLEHQLSLLKLSQPPIRLQKAILHEQQKRGFRSQIVFDLDH